MNASRSRDVGDAIPYMVGVFHKDAIPYMVGTIYKANYLEMLLQVFRVDTKPSDLNRLIIGYTNQKN